MAQIVALDTLVFIYVLNADAVFGPASREVLDMAQQGRLQAISSQLTYLEALSSPKLQTRDIVIVKRLLESSVVEFCPITYEVLEQAAALRRRHTFLKTPDSIHLASAISRQSDYFVTSDKRLLKLRLNEISILPLLDASHALSVS